MPQFMHRLHSRFRHTLSACGVGLCGLLASMPAQAATITPGGSAVMQCDATLKGEIADGDAARLRAFVDEQGWKIDVFGPGDVSRTKKLCLESQGGSYLAGIELGEAIRSLGISTAVGPDQACESACALAFMFGWAFGEEASSTAARRLHPRGKLGFHAPGLVVPKGGYTEEAVNAAYRVAIKSIEEFVKARGVGDKFFAQDLFLIMLGTPPDEMRYVRTVEDAAVWNIEIFPTGCPANDRVSAVRHACTNAQRNAEAYRSSFYINRNAKFIDGVQRGDREIKIVTTPFFFTEGGSTCSLRLSRIFSTDWRLDRVEFEDRSVHTTTPLYRFFFFPPDMPIADIPLNAMGTDAEFFEALAGTRPMPGSGTRVSVGPLPAPQVSGQGVFATEADEDRLGLDRAARREIQRRLTLIGFDTGGVDGALGPRSRTAIRLWQQARGFPASGYLNTAQRQRLVEDSRESYDKWIAKEAAQSRKKRGRVCQRDPLGVLVNCRTEWR